MTKKGKLIPYIIIVAFIAFGAYIIRFVVLAHDSKVNLVSDDYYAKEVAFQDQIEINKTSLPFKSNYNVVVEGEELTVTFAEELQGMQGDLVFYRPADHDMDFKMKLNLNSKSKMVIKSDQIPSGYWKVKAFGEKEGKEYFFEKELTLR